MIILLFLNPSVANFILLTIYAHTFSLNFSGFLPIPDNFTTVGRPQIVVNQYDSPLDVYGEDTLEEMKEERLTMQNPEVMERIEKVKPPQNPLEAMQQRAFDPSKSSVLGCIDDVQEVRGE